MEDNVAGMKGRTDEMKEFEMEHQSEQGILRMAVKLVIILCIISFYLHSKKLECATQKNTSLKSFSTNLTFSQKE